jgi:adenylate cyclase
MKKTIAIMMADLSGFTALTEIHGSEMAAYMISKYVELVGGSLQGESFMLERVGDQVVVISPDPDHLAATAFALLENSRKERHFLAIHAGLHYGEALEMTGHYYGAAINLTARIAAKAKDGKILCSKDFIDALSNTEAFRYEYHGQVNFKNVLESKEIVELLPVERSKGRDKSSCPVCQMQLDENEKSFHFSYEGTSFYFCSEECREIFEKHQMYNLQLVS